MSTASRDWMRPYEKKSAVRRTDPVDRQRRLDKDVLPQSEQGEMQNEADIALRKARGKAEVERAPGGKGASRVDEAGEAGEEQTGA
jgi:hypothetical protein